MKDLESALGIDLSSASQRRAITLTENDADLIRDLIALREEQGLSQQVVAERLGVTQATISAFERYDNDPKLSTIRRYAHAVGAFVDHSVSKDTESEPTEVAPPDTGSGKIDGPDAAGAAHRISVAVAEKDNAAALESLKQYWSTLAWANGVDRIMLTASSPELTGLPIWDAAVAAVSEYWLTQDHLPQPDWIEQAGRTLAEPESLPGTEKDPAPDHSLIAPAFRKRNILFEVPTQVRAAKWFEFELSWTERSNKVSAQLHPEFIRADGSSINSDLV